MVIMMYVISIQYATTLFSDSKNHLGTYIFGNYYFYNDETTAIIRDIAGKYSSQSNKNTFTFYVEKPWLEQIVYDVTRTLSSFL